ncbi:MAG: 50S ribosomal protein L15 [Candidatus Magasanikbacteria bacterium]|jgi:large subunit ribosomal protein L15
MSLQPHTIKSATGARRSRKMRGRGNASGHGNYSGHGGKGQTARSGGSRGLRVKAFRRLMQSTPKLGGFHSHFVRATEVTLKSLEKCFKAGEIVNLESLKKAGLIKLVDRSAKILNTGEITKALQVEGIKFTKIAKEKIEKAGGSVK